MKIIESMQKKNAIKAQVYILGGSPCSGKSTIAKKLSNQFQLDYYNVDDHNQEHVKQCNLLQHPTVINFSRMGWNEIWSRPIPVLVNEEIEYYREIYEMILRDLQEFKSGKTIIVEGAALMPELIISQNIDKKKVLYMVPTKEFQIHHYSQREFIHHILKDCENPEQAFENWMMRDHLFGKEILEQAKILDFGALVVDGKRSIDEQFDYVRKYYGFL